MGAAWAHMLALLSLYKSKDLAMEKSQPVKGNNDGKKVGLGVLAFIVGFTLLLILLKMVLGF